MSKYSTRYKSKKNKYRSKINKSRRFKKKYNYRKHRKKTRKRKQKRTRRRNVNAGRAPPYTKKELLYAIRGAFVVATVRDNPFAKKFVKVTFLLKYVNWLNSMDEFHDKIDEYNEKTNLVNIVNMLYDSYSEHGTYENALDNIIRDLAGLAMRGVPDRERQRHNAAEAAEEGKVITDFQNPTDMMIDNYFHHLYPRVERVSHTIEKLVDLPDDWRSILE